ncbi:MAG TPA: hypothetical protein EYH56_02180 [Nanoarchaeota archaeon]|nr:hypothetical protein [Nanoarchaeota archaeon]
MYYDLVHEHLEINEKTVRFLKFMGWNGVGVIKVITNPNQQFLQKPEKKYLNDFVIFPVVEIKAQSVVELKKILRKVREKFIVVCVHGGDYQINRAACEDSRVDILFHPELERSDNGLDEYSLKKAKENEVAIGINFRYILETHRKHRVIMLKNISENIRLCHEIGVDMIISSCAKSIWEIRDPRALASFLNVLGMELGKAIKSSSQILEKIVEKNEKILSGITPVKGVEVVDHES